jgi:GNAT superfamily N-acetyltransferase
MAGSASRSAPGELTITTSAGVDDALRDRVLEGLDAALPEVVPASGRTPLAVLLHAARGQLVGALTGRTLWGWLVIDLLWVDAAARGVGHGRRRIAAAEQEALRRGCHHARVDTYSFQAPGFYERCGYARVATLDDFPRGHQRHFYAKALA